jgi:hypothetical protein
MFQILSGLVLKSKHSAKMGTFMDEQERQALAKHLAGFKFQRARSEIRRLDPSAILKFWRNGVGHHLHTVYELPNLSLRVILVEAPETKAIPDSTLVRSNPRYIEAQVQPLPARKA